MMKRLLATLGMGLILISFVLNTPAVGEQSSSLDPTARSWQQCTVNYGTLIDFEGQAAGTVINNQYLPDVTFGAAAGGPVTEANTDGARPADNIVLGGRPLYIGDIHAKFWKVSKKGYVTKIGATVGWCDAVGAVTMQAFDCKGNFVGAVSNTLVGVEFMTILAPEIHKVIFLVGGDDAGASIDCFTYDYVQPCPDDIPTLTQWGLIILIILLLAAGVIAVIRRHNAATV